MKLKLCIIFFLIVFSSFGFSEKISYDLGFNVIKTKYMEIDAEIEIPIYIESYSKGSSFTYQTQIFKETEFQKIQELEAYYFLNDEKIFAEILEDDYKNKIAYFDVNEIKTPKYTFYINAKIISDNTLFFKEQTHTLENKISEHKEFTQASRYINSDSSEIISVSNNFQKTNNSLKDLVEVVNWVRNYIEYDLNYNERLLESTKILVEKKGVCSEYAILAASILREKGVPVKYVTGYANSSKEWEAHAWLSAYLPEQGWFYVDPTFGEVGLVDASHLVISETKDPSEVKDRVVSLGKVELSFGNKIKRFDVRDYKTFSDVFKQDPIEVSFEVSEDIKQDSLFKVPIKIKNKTQNPISFLFSLDVSVPQDFEIVYPEYKKQIVYLEPNKDNDFLYYLKAENTGILENTYKQYFLFMDTQFDTYNKKINVFKDQGHSLDIFLVTPILFSLGNNVLESELKFVNFTTKEKNIDMLIDYNGVIETKHINVLPKQIKKISEKHFVKSNSNFSVSFSGDYEASKDFFIFENAWVDEVAWVDENVYEHKDAPVKQEQIVKKKTLKDHFKNDFYKKEDWVGIFLIILFFVFVLVVFFVNKNRGV